MRRGLGRGVIKGPAFLCPKAWGYSLPSSGSLDREGGQAPGCHAPWGASLGSSSWSLGAVQSRPEPQGTAPQSAHGYRKLAWWALASGLGGISSPSPGACPPSAQCPPTPVCPRCTSKLTEWTRVCPCLSPYCPLRPRSPHGGRGLCGKITEALALGLA